MRNAAAVLLMAAATLAAPADSLARAERDLAKAAKALEAAPDKAGKKRIAKLQLVKARLHSARRIVNSTLPRADESLHPALIGVRDRAVLQLVSILNEETGYYLRANKKSTARKRNREALKLMPKDKDALDYQKQLAGKKPSAKTKAKSGGSRQLSGDLETRRSSLPGLEHRARHDGQAPGRRAPVGTARGHAR
jgi:hypothetical protein